MTRLAEKIQNGHKPVGCPGEYNEDSPAKICTERCFVFICEYVRQSKEEKEGKERCDRCNPGKLLIAMGIGLRGDESIDCVNKALEFIKTLEFIKKCHRKNAACLLQDEVQGLEEVYFKAAA